MKMYKYTPVVGYIFSTLAEKAIEGYKELQATQQPVNPMQLYYENSQNVRWFPN